MFQYIFGPIISRRLGRSLGIDLLPAKTCSMDCIYCECGATTNLTTERKEWVPTELVLQELEQVLKTNPELDFITFSGSGEPTLHTQISQIIQWIKRNYPQYKICCLTNGSTLDSKEIAQELSLLDLIIPSLDGASQSTFNAITKAHSELNIQKIITGIRDFKQKNPLIKLYLEIFIIPGLNDSPQDIKDFQNAVSIIKPDRIQLNSIDRPGVKELLYPPSKEIIMQFYQSLSPLAPVDFYGKNKIDFNSIRPKQYSNTQELIPQILSCCSRRPCTKNDLVFIYGGPSQIIEDVLQQLHQEKKLKLETEGDRIFYRTILTEQS